MHFNIIILLQQTYIIQVFNVFIILVYTKKLEKGLKFLD